MTDITIVEAKTSVYIEFSRYNVPIEKNFLVIRKSLSYSKNYPSWIIFLPNIDNSRHVHSIAVI